MAAWSRELAAPRSLERRRATFSRSASIPRFDETSRRHGGTIPRGQEPPFRWRSVTSSREHARHAGSQQVRPIGTTNRRRCACLNTSRSRRPSSGDGARPADPRTVEAVEAAGTPTTMVCAAERPLGRAVRAPRRRRRDAARALTHGTDVEAVTIGQAAQVAVVDANGRVLGEPLAQDITQDRETWLATTWRHVLIASGDRRRTPAPTSSARGPRCGGKSSGDPGQVDRGACSSATSRLASWSPSSLHQFDDPRIDVAGGGSPSQSAHRRRSVEHRPITATGRVSR